MNLVKPLIALLAIVNPLGIIPFFILFTESFSREQKRKTILISSLSAFLVIAVSTLIGADLLHFFGISIASFQVGGGMLLLISAISMLNAKTGATKSTSDEVEEAAERASVAVVPLTIPLLTGPATISTVIIYASKTQHWWQHAVLIGYGVIIAAAAALSFLAAEPIARFLGKTGINVMTRLMGLILSALSVEMMSDGLLKLFPGLGR
ncbi:MarC family protein [Thiomonas sp.]|jgi:multiple antibiotic resistance protein|uniref:MarC family protein n=1 Tax=Thiomonas sp. TaxID=2047785 RepID=UPI0026392B88|nr:MarC family protein [Thiomonas sp.]